MADLYHLALAVIVIEKNIPRNPKKNQNSAFDTTEKAMRFWMRCRPAKIIIVKEARGRDEKQELKKAAEDRVFPQTLISNHKRPYFLNISQNESKLKIEFGVT